MDLVRKEFELRGKEKHNTVLRDFLNNSEEKLRRLKSDARAAGEAFRECVEFFGESPRQADANTFFSLLVRFSRAFKVFSIILTIKCFALYLNITICIKCIGCRSGKRTKTKIRISSCGSFK